MEEDCEYNLLFEHPARFLIFGPSCSGKTTFVQNYLNKLSDFYDFEFDRIVYCSESGSSIKTNINDKIIFKSELNEDLINTFQPSKNNLLIIDDMMQNVINNQISTDLFTKRSHHSNITILFLTQNLYPKSKYMRDVSINSNYIVLMKNPIERLQINILSNRIEGKTKDNRLLLAYKEATEKPYSYLLIDLCQKTPNILKYRSNIFDENFQTVYI